MRSGWLEGAREVARVLMVILHIELLQHVFGRSEAVILDVLERLRTLLLYFQLCLEES